MIADAERKPARVEAELARALSIVDSAEVPLAEWRIHETAARFSRPRTPPGRPGLEHALATEACADALARFGCPGKRTVTYWAAAAKARRPGRRRR
jgi:hypothetical protein